MPTSTVFFATGLGYYLYNYGTRGQFTKMRLLLFSIELVQWTGGEGLWRISDHACPDFYRTTRGFRIIVIDHPYGAIPGSA